jgi:hypothetical protein
MFLTLPGLKRLANIPVTFEKFEIFKFTSSLLQWKEVLCLFSQLKQFLLYNSCAYLQTL